MLTNAKIKEIKKLNERSKARREAGLFIIEGPKMFSEAPLEWIEEVFVTEEFLQNADAELKTNSDDKIGEMIKWLEHTIVTKEQMSKISDTMTPQGILCVMRQPEYSIEHMMVTKKRGKLFVLLEDIQDPGNLGTIFRTAEGAGASGIIMSRGCVDIFNPKTIRSTMGSIYRVPFVYADDFADAINKVKGNGINVYAAHLKGEKYYDEITYEDAAFLIGNEGNGLKAETAKLSDTYIKIPMEGELESLNAAVATAILMYEHNRQHR